MEWRFDQEKNVAAISTRQVCVENFPILLVVHYSEDHSWAFTCGITNKSEDMLVVNMGEIVEKDSSLHEIADLPPGWCAERNSACAEWRKYKDDSI